MPDEKRKVRIAIIGHGYHENTLGALVKNVEIVDPKCKVNCRVDGPRNREERRKAERSKRKRGQ